MKISPQKLDHKITEIGKIPEEWEVVRLSEVADIFGGSTPSTTRPEYWGGDIPFVTPTDITNLNGNNILSKTKKRITKKGLNAISARILPPGSVLITSRASIGFAAVNDVPVVTNQGFVNIVCKSKIYNLYVLYLIRFLKRKLEQLASGSTFREVSRKSLKKLLIPLPPLPEQRKIASILSTVDDAIQKTDEIIQKAQELKRGLMQQLLTKGIGHTKFKQTEIGEIPEEWEVVKLGDIADFKNGINFSKEQKGHEGVPTVDVLNMYGEGVYLDLKNLYRVKISLNNDDYLLKRGDILFVRSSLKREGAGWASLFKGWDEPVTFCGFIIRARLNNTNILPEFLTYFLRSDSARRELISGAGQVAVTNVSQDFLKTMKFPLPPLPEHRKIVSIFATVGEKIEKERQRKEQLEKLKKGLMQDLLTGGVRVKT